MTDQPTVYAISLTEDDEITHPETGQIVRVTEVAQRGVSDVHVYVTTLAGHHARGFITNGGARVTIHNI